LKASSSVMPCSPYQCRDSPGRSLTRSRAGIRRAGPLSVDLSGNATCCRGSPLGEEERPEPMYHSLPTCPTIHLPIARLSLVGSALHPAPPSSAFVSARSIEVESFPGPVGRGEVSPAGYIDQVGPASAAFAAAGQGEIDQGRPPRRIEAASRLVAKGQHP